VSSMARGRISAICLILAVLRLMSVSTGDWRDNNGDLHCLDLVVRHVQAELVSTAANSVPSGSEQWSASTRHNEFGFDLHATVDGNVARETEVFRVDDLVGLEGQSTKSETLWRVLAQEVLPKGC
jgi:hypothetical protein